MHTNFNKRSMDDPYGASIFSYVRIADLIRRVSSNVAHDVQELYARMILNVLSHNTDDHLKNTGFLMDGSGADFRYRLSPLFDVVTQEGNTKHMLHIGPMAGHAGTLENALSGAARWGLKTQAAQAIIDQVQRVFNIGAPTIHEPACDQRK